MFLLGVTFVVLPELEGNLTENTIVALTVTEVLRPANKNTEFRASSIVVNKDYKSIGKILKSILQAQISHIVQLGL